MEFIFFGRVGFYIALFLKDLADASDNVRKDIAEFAASFARLDVETDTANEDDR